MIIIPGFLIAIVTFPGVIIHEAAHLLFCKLRKVAVFDVCYFQTKDPAGYVLHEKIDNFNTTFLVSMGPFFVNSLLCVLICLPAFMPVHVFQLDDFYSYVLIWLGISMGMHAFPSNEDSNAIWNHAKEEAKKFNPLAIISFPMVILIHIANIARFFWADVLYGLAIGLWLPVWILDYTLKYFL